MKQYRFHVHEDVKLVADGRKRPGVFSLLEDSESGEPQISISGRGVWFSAGDPEMSIEIFPANIEKIIYHAHTITIYLVGKKFHSIDISFKSVKIKEKCETLLHEKFEEASALLTQVGKETLQLVQTNTLVRAAFPNHFWKLSYRAEKLSLYFSISVDYAAVMREFDSHLMDPTSWIGVVAFFAGGALRMYAAKLPKQAQITFSVNQPTEDSSGELADLINFSGTVSKLVAACDEAEDKPIREVVVIMLVAME